MRSLQSERGKAIASQLSKQHVSEIYDAYERYEYPPNAGIRFGAMHNSFNRLVAAPIWLAPRIKDIYNALHSDVISVQIVSRELSVKLSCSIEGYQKILVRSRSFPSLPSTSKMSDLDSLSLEDEPGDEGSSLPSPTHSHAPFFGLFGSQSPLNVHDLESARSVHVRAHSVTAHWDSKSLLQASGALASEANFNGGKSDPRFVDTALRPGLSPMHAPLRGLPLSRVNSESSDIITPEEPRQEKYGTFSGVVFPTLEFMWSVIIL